jgi:hypothetical protein
MKGNLAEIPTLSRKAEAFLTALLGGQSVSRACISAKVSESTGWRYLQSPAFQTRWRAARRAVIESAIAEMQSLTSEAVQCLRKQLNGANAAASVRAASVIIQRALEGIDLMDYEQRLAAIEARLQIGRRAA